MSGQWDGIEWPVRTARLELRPSTPDDTADVFALRSHPDVAEWGYRWPRDAGAFAEIWTELCESHLSVLLGGTLIGDFMLHIRDGWAQLDVADQAERAEAELGYAFHPDHHGKGYATEAGAAVLEIAFASLGVRRVTAGVFADNVPSWRLLERLGMRREGHNLRDSLHRERGWLDGYTYALLADERSPARD